jgi:hypothetical protein
LNYLNFLVVVRGCQLDEGLSTLSGLFALGLIFFSPSKHITVIVTEDTGVVKLIRDLKDHLADFWGQANSGSEQQIENLFVLDSGHSVCKRFLIESDFRNDRHLVLRDTDQLTCLTQVILRDGRASVHRPIRIEKSSVVGHGLIQNRLVGRESSKSELDVHLNCVTGPTTAPCELFGMSSYFEEE